MAIAAAVMAPPSQPARLCGVVIVSPGQQSLMSALSSFGFGGGQLIMPTLPALALACAQAAAGAAASATAAAVSTILAVSLVSLRFMGSLS
jgi:hypothetical protein